MQLGNAQQFVAMVTRNCVMTMTNRTLNKISYMDIFSGKMLENKNIMN
jgi:hypothetical protein